MHGSRSASIDAIQESYGDRAGNPFAKTLVQDIRYGVRILRRNPGVTPVAILTLALGVGANIAMFSVADAGVLRPLGVEDPDRIVRISNVKISSGHDANPDSSGPEYEAFPQGSHSLSGIAASDRRGVLVGKEVEGVGVGRMVITIALLKIGAPICFFRCSRSPWRCCLVDQHES
jgi:hypothetical protein